MKKPDLETPALLVDHERLVRNVREMQKVASDAGVALRPHVKTHKCPELAKLQLAEGASGICVQKLGEAEIMVEAGIRDIFLTNQIVQPTKIERLVKLQENATIKVVVDSLDNAAAIGKAAVSAGRTVPILLEVDSGMRRCGVPFGPAIVTLSNELSRIDGVRFEGLETYEGHLYHFDKKRRDKTAKRLIGRLIETAKKIRKAGVDVSVISCGSTPTAAAVAGVPGVTEIQPGNYVFYDVMQVEAGSTRLENCALRVLTTVITTSSSNRVVVDAGTKAFAHDRGQFPKALGLRNVKPVGIYEEQLILRTNPKTTKLRVGDKIEFIPYHACTAVNMHDEIQVVKDDDVIATWPIAATGKML